MQGAREHNLRNLTVTFPLGAVHRGHRRVRLGQVDAGQRHPLHGAGQPAQRRPAGARAGTPRVTGLDQVDKVVGVDQSPIGRTPRSNPATYTGVFDHIRKLFAETTEAKVRGYGPGRFSFNVKGGRCEACAGDGTIKIEMNFLPDVYVPCEVCKGARYNRETLEVHYKGKTIAEVLDMPIEEAADVLRGDPGDPPPPEDAGRRRPRLRPARASRRRRCPAARRSGSSWPPSCRSGPPAARSTCSTSRPPACTSRTSASCCWCSTGLVDKGNTVIVIEHNLDVIKTADWVIDMGPEGGHRGGTVVAHRHAGGDRRGRGEPHRRLPAPDAGPPARRSGGPAKALARAAKANGDGGQRQRQGAAAKATARPRPPAEEPRRTAKAHRPDEGRRRPHRRSATPAAEGGDGARPRAAKAAPAKAAPRRRRRGRRRPTDRRRPRRTKAASGERSARTGPATAATIATGYRGRASRTPREDTRRRAPRRRTPRRPDPRRYVPAGAAREGAGTPCRAVRAEPVQGRPRPSGAASSRRCVGRDSRSARNHTGDVDLVRRGVHSSVTSSARYRAPGRTVPTRASERRSGQCSYDLAGKSSIRLTVRPRRGIADE